MDDAAIRLLAGETAKAAVKETFIALGVDMADPVGVQRDFAFLRTFRTYTSLARKTVLTTFVAGVLGGLGTAAVKLGFPWPGK